jgi:hypothetical protein
MDDTEFKKLQDGLHEYNKACIVVRIGAIILFAVIGYCIWIIAQKSVDASDFTVKNLFVDFILCGIFMILELIFAIVNFIKAYFINTLKANRVKVYNGKNPENLLLLPEIHSGQVHYVNGPGFKKYFIY